MKTDPAQLPYRPCVGLMLVDGRGRIFVGRRKDTPDAWQMPQGGIDEGETPRQAALRELKEEVGTDKAKIIAESTEWYRYELPPHLLGKVWGGRYRGQEQKWVLCQFTGTDADIDLTAHEPEFDAWEWVDPDDLIRRIVPFKRQIYRAVVAEFGPLLDYM